MKLGCPNKEQPARQLSGKFFEKSCALRPGRGGRPPPLRNQQREKTVFRRTDWGGEAAASLGRRVGPEPHRRKRSFAGPTDGGKPRRL
jgi:hypothetical protein